jgi:hypothetical protein
MRRIERRTRTALAVASVLLAVGANSSADPGDRVVTIYFAGTGAHEAWAYSWGSAWGQPELLASLYREQSAYIASLDGETNHYAHFEAGVGVTNAGWFNVACAMGCCPNSVFVDGYCNGWLAINTRTLAFLANEGFKDLDPGQKVILNLIGWSRGCISPMILQAYFTTDGVGLSMIRHINIVTLDPVAGDPTVGPNVLGNDWNYVIFDHVKNYIQISATDERSASSEESVGEFWLG